MFNFIKKLTKRDYKKNKELARALVHQKLAHFAGVYKSRHSIELTYKRVSIKNTKSRWGSCSSKGNLNFNYKIIFLPEPLVDYLIVHELCHLKEMNHKAEFWNLVSKEINDWNIKRNSLRKLKI